MPFPFLKPKATSTLPELHGSEEKRQLKLGIIVGHEKKAKGASLAKPFNTPEYDYNTEIAAFMHDEAIKSGHILPVVIMRDNIGITGAYKKAEQEKCDCVIELHFNACNGTVEGTETLCTPNSEDIEFATIIQNAMCRVFERSGASRGVKTLPRSARGGINIYSFPNGANCLVEPFFGDHPREAQIATARKHDYASALVNAVVVWGKKHLLI